ncbi:MAG: thioredoxin family protein [Chitinophagaceae bacterium]|nr:thioredoxin family protein [Chitinophagaceae bacterium]
MRTFFLAIFSIILFSSCGSSKLSVGKDYIIIPDDRSKILSGKINRSLIENDTSFAWFKKNIQYGEADASAVAAIQKNAQKFNLVVVTGTWCQDSWNLLPKFYRLLAAAGYPESKLLLIGVDRKKLAYKNLQTPYHILNTPTFIVMQNGKEMGRVVEYGKTGYMEKELGEIIAGL